MPEPYNYSLNIKQPDLAADFARGMQLGEMSRQNEFEMQQKQQSMALAQQKQERLAAAMAKLRENKTSSGFLSVLDEYPELSADMEPYLKNLKEGEREILISQATDEKMALAAGRPDIALESIKRFKEASENSGQTEWAKQAEMRYKLIESSETGEVGNDAAGLVSNIFLAKALGHEKYAEAFEKLDKQAIARSKAPSELKESEAKAAEAAVKAKFAESKAVQDLEKGGWDIRKMQNDIDVSKQNSKIALMNTSLARETNDLKRKELGLKIQETIDKRDEYIRDKAAEQGSILSTLDNMIATATKAAGTPMGVIGSAAGPVSSRVPTISQDTADFEESVNTLKSQVFLTQVQAMKGTLKGALSDAEGAKLETSMKNLSLRQSPEQLLDNINEIKRLMTKARTNAIQKFGIPDPGIDYGPNKGAASVDDLMKMLGK